MTDTEPEHDLQQTLTGGFHEQPDPDSEPDRDLQQALETSQTIVDRFHEQPSPDHIYALVSGGGDSDTACDVAQECGIDLDGVCHVNTGIGVERTRRYVMDQCIKRGLSYHELTGMDDALRKRRDDGIDLTELQETPDGLVRRYDTHPYEGLDTNYYGTRRPNDKYERIVRKMGAPGPGYHWVMYLALKHKPIVNFVTECHPPDETVAFVSGVRKNESDRRAENMSDNGLSTNWDDCPVVSPLAEWTDSHVTDYRRDRDLESNPVSDILGMSAECLCSAFGSREELEQLKGWDYPVAQQIEHLEMELYQGQVSKGYIPPEYALWGHGNTDQPNTIAEDEPDQMLLCADCENKCDPAVMTDGDSISPAEEALNSRAHCDSDRWFFCPDCDVIIDDPIEHRRTVHAVTPTPPYLDHLPWDIREISLPTHSDSETAFSERQFDSPLVTDPTQTKDRRMNNYLTHNGGQWIGDHSCEFEPTDRDGITQCRDCGKYQINTDGTLRSRLAAADDGLAVTQLLTIEPGILSAILPHTSLDATDVITSQSELETATTADEVATLLVDRVNSVSEYLDTDPTFGRLVRDAGIDVFCDQFGVTPRDVLDPDAHDTILSQLTDVAADEDADNTPPLQPRFNPDRQSISQFQ